MQHLFLPYNLALLAKEKGFNEPCLGLYIENEFLLYSHYGGFNNPMNFNVEILLSAPLYQQIVDWFREKHHYYIKITFGYSEIPVWEWEILHINDPNISYNTNHRFFNSYQEVLNAAIQKAFKLI